MTAPEKLRRHPNQTLAGRCLSFLRALVQFCQEPTSRVFEAFSLSPVLPFFALSHARNKSMERVASCAENPTARCTK